MAIQPVGGYLNNSALSTLVSELEKQGSLLRSIRNHLPDFLGQHCVHCIHKSGNLILYVDSPAFATQMRFHTAALLPAVNRMTRHQFTSIQVRTQVADRARPAVQPSQIRADRKKSGQHLLESAEDHPAGDMQAALWRLGKTLTRD